MPEQKKIHAMDAKSSILLFLHKSEASIEKISNEHLVAFITAD